MSAEIENGKKFVTSGEAKDIMGKKFLGVSEFYKLQDKINKGYV